MTFLRTFLMFIFLLTNNNTYTFSQENLTKDSNQSIDLNVLKCVLMPSTMSCRFFRKSDVELCESIKGFDRGVETFDNYSSSLKEAKRRGLNCRVNDEEKPSIASTQIRNSGKRPLASKLDSFVCSNATTILNGSKVWDDTNKNFVGEANYRGLDCGVFKHNLQNIHWCVYETVKKAYNKKSISHLPYWMPENQNCGNAFKYSDISEKDAAFLYSKVEYFNNHICSEKLKKPLTRFTYPYFLLNIQYSLCKNPKYYENYNAEKIVVHKKDKSKFNDKVELKKEREKRLEEERKRKALEQRIAELEKKNKELQQPKKQQKAKPKSGSGSGFFISKLGHIITNQHVVNKCSRITVGDRIDKQVPAELLETDKRNDLALLKTTSLKLASAETKSLIQKLSIEIVPLATGGLMRGNDVKLGEDVLVAGFPYGDIFSKNIKVTKGIVSSTTGIKDDSGQFQLDAAVQPGNSGGPIYDKYGNIVGVVVAQLNKFKMAKAIGSLPENVNFGIKASTVKQFLNESIPTRWSERTKEISTTKLSEIAKKQTVMVVCHR